MRARFSILLLLSLIAGVPIVMAADQPVARAACNHDEERDGDLCYPRCKSGYIGDGDECVQVCPSNSQDYGNKCLMGPAAVLKKFYARGAGRIVQ